MKVRSEPETHEESFDLTPMIDVMLFVFLFFLVATQFSQLERTPLDLPRETGEGESQDTPGSVIISMDRQGNLSLDGESMDAESVIRRVSMKAKGLSAPDLLSVIVRADRRCPAGHLNRLAARLVGADIRRWMLATAGEE